MFASAICPEWIRNTFVHSYKHMICQLELLAVITANLTFRSFLTGQRVLYFEDNTAALSALVHGYSGKEDMARLANMYHLLNFDMRVNAWHEWVPSKANIADIPSRPRFSTDADGGRDLWGKLQELGAEEFKMVLPSPEDMASLRSWRRNVTELESR